MKIIQLGAALATAALVAVGGTQSEKGTKPPQVGDAAPAFRLNDQQGRAVSIGGKSDTWTVVAFFPKAMTPGWKAEVCSLRDAAAIFEELGVAVYGVSLDPVADQAKFHEQQELNFPLLSDPDGSAAAKLGVLPEGARWTERVTFVIDDQGVVRAIDDKVNVGSHGHDLAERVVQLQE